MRIPQAGGVFEVLYTERHAGERADVLFVPADEVMPTARREGAVPFDVPDVEFGHHGPECSFDALVKKYGLTADPALVLLAKIDEGMTVADLGAVLRRFFPRAADDDNQLSDEVSVS